MWDEWKLTELCASYWNLLRHQPSVSGNSGFSVHVPHSFIPCSIFFSSFYIDIYPIFFLDSKTYSEYSNALSFLSRIVFLLYFRDVPCDFVSLQSCDYVRYNLSCRMSKEGHENGIKLVAGAQKQKNVVGDLNAPSNRAHVTVMLRPRIGIKWWAPVWSLFFSWPPDHLVHSLVSV